MIRQSKASAGWRGGLKDGKGTFSVASGVISNVNYDFGKRFESAPGTNPEELVGAAHAACFAMALSADLEKANFKPESVDATSTVSLDMKDGKPTVTKIQVDAIAKVPGATLEQLKSVAEGTRTGCPIARLLNAEITLDIKQA